MSTAASSLLYGAQGQESQTPPSNVSPKLCAQRSRPPPGDPRAPIVFCTTSVPDLCDFLANTPGDPDKIGVAADADGKPQVIPGVPFADIQVVGALPACQKAAALNSTPHYVFLYGRVLLAAQRYAGAFQQLRSAAERGYVAAILDLGLSYHNGLGVPKSDAEAAAWLRKAAHAGQLDAMYSLGNLYESGQGVPKSDADAATWYSKAADAGHPASMLSLGLMYEEGRGVHQDDGSAVNWYIKAAQM